MNMSVFTCNTTKIMNMNNNVNFYNKNSREVKRVGDEHN